MVTQPYLQAFQRNSLQDYQKAEAEFEARKRERAMQAQMGQMSMDRNRLEMDLLKRKINQGPEFNLQGETQRALLKHYSGGTLTPRDMAILNTAVALNPGRTTYKADESGRVIAQTEPNPLQAIIGGIGGTNGQIEQQYKLPQATQLSVTADIQSENKASVPVVQRDTTDYYATGPKALMKGADADIDAAKSGASTLLNKRAEQQAVQEMRLKVIPTIKQNALAVQKEINNLPSGGLEDVTGKAANWFGFPVEAQRAKAAINAPLKAMVLDMKRLARDAGEGVFTKDDQEFVQSFVFNPDDEYTNKVASFKAFNDVLQRIENRLTSMPLGEQIEGSSPGFRYIGKVK